MPWSLALVVVNGVELCLPAPYARGGEERPDSLHVLLGPNGAVPSPPNFPIRHSAARYRLTR
jgi:hypothetical protein